VLLHAAFDSLAPTTTQGDNDEYGDDGVQTGGVVHSHPSLQVRCLPSSMIAANDDYEDERRTTTAINIPPADDPSNDARLGSSPLVPSSRRTVGSGPATSDNGTQTPRSRSSIASRTSSSYRVERSVIYVLGTYFFV
jgi:hypothetical protein